MRFRASIAFVGIALALPACLAGRFATEASDRLAQPPEAGVIPEIDLMVTARSADACAVFLDGYDSDRRAIAERTAAALGFPGRIAHEDDFSPDTDTIRLGGRLIEREDDERWVMDFDASEILPILRDAGYDEAILVLCTPPVETRLRASRPADLGDLDVVCDLGGRGWTFFTTDEPLRFRATFVPEPADYLGYAAGVLLATVLFGALAWFLGDKLRSGPFRRRSAASVAIGLIGGGFAAFGLGALTAGVGAAAGPAANLVLARDLGAGGYASSVLFPSLIATAPGIIFATKLLRRGTHDDDDRIAPMMPVPPPGPPGAPPLPWS
jgi:hypothetical protein